MEFVSLPDHHGISRSFAAPRKKSDIPRTTPHRRTDMAKHIVKPLLGQILQKIAPRIGATVLMEPEWGIVGQITYKNGLRRYFKYSSLDVNPLASSDIAKDKDYASF